MKTSCPTCRKEVEWEGNLFRPFCSERCKLIDLGNWATESYRVPSEEDQEEDENPLSSRSDEAPGEEEESASHGKQNGTPPLG